MGEFDCQYLLTPVASESKQELILDCLITAPFTVAHPDIRVGMSDNSGPVPAGRRWYDREAYEWLWRHAVEVGHPKFPEVSVICHDGLYDSWTGIIATCPVLPNKREFMRSVRREIRAHFEYCAGHSLPSVFSIWSRVREWQSHTGRRVSPETNVVQWD